MNMDTLTAIGDFASSIFSAGMDFLFAWGESIGVISMITLLARARSAGPVEMSPGKFIVGMLTSCTLVSLPAMINARGVQMGFRADSFGPIAYVQPQMFGAAVGAANVILPLTKLAGVGFVMNGTLIWRKAGLNGHTTLSVSESASKGSVKFIAGTLLVFIDRVLNTLLASIGIVFRSFSPPYKPLIYPFREKLCHVFVP